MMTFISQQLIYRGMRASLKSLNRLGVKREATEFYFGYGANLNVDRFTNNHMIASTMGTASLPGYELCFGLQSQYKGLGYASLKKSANASVWGQLYRIDRLSLWLLDVMEFVPYGSYRRQKMEVECLGRKIIAHVYVAQKNKKGLKPSKRYLDLIVAGSLAHKYPDSYVEKLRATPFLDVVKVDHEFTMWTASRKRHFAKQLLPLYKSHDQIREKLLTYLRHLG